MVSKFYENFLIEVLRDSLNTDDCINIVKGAYYLSTHLVRARSVARAAGFCAFYGRMAEKMGVLEVLEGSSITRGRDVHRILNLASLNFFLDNPLFDEKIHGEKVEKLIESYIENAFEEIKNMYRMDKESVVVAKRLLYRLLTALPKAKSLLGLEYDDPLFPIVEQQYADYKSRIYGAPDLILESKKKEKAIVIEWKTYTSGLKSKSHSVSDFEKAQVIAYSILEARRLGIRNLRNIFESISGVDLEVIKEIMRRLRERSRSNERSLSHGPSMREINISSYIKSKGLLKILPIIVAPSGGYPPHPLMYKEQIYEKIYERFAKLYKIFIGVVVAAEHLALQIMNIPELIRTTSIAGYDDIKSLCTTKEGYQAYSLTPFKFLKGGKPGNWNKYPCKLCGFKGDDGPCYFYFGSKKPSDYFDKLMWWARYKVYSRRERDLISLRAMYEIFKNPLSKNVIFKGNPVEIEVDFSRAPSLSVRFSHRDTTLYFVRAKRGQQDLGKFRFDYFKISDVEFDRDNQAIELKRKLRTVEIQNNIIGFLRKSLYLSIIELDRNVDPLLTINTFVMIDSTSISEDYEKVVYRCYCPSPVLIYNFMIFGKYVEFYKKNNLNAYVLAYEAPVDLTIMELRSIDSLHRYLKTVASKPNEIIEELKKHNIVELDREDLVNESKLLEKYVPRDERDLNIPAYQLYKILRDKMIDTGGSSE